MLRSFTALSNNKILEEAHFIPVSAQEVQKAYIAYIGEQFQNYFHTAVGANPGNAIPATVEKDSLFDAEHVDGILRYLIGKDLNLANHVGVFPTFNQDAFFRQACDFVVNKMIQDPNFKKLVKDTSPLIEVSKCANHQELLNRNFNERYRTQQDNEANEHAVRILKENEISDDNLFFLYLKAIAEFEESKLGNKTNPLLTFANCNQFIIPIRQSNHYTVAVVNCDKDENTAVIEYYNSMGSDLDENKKNQLIMAFLDIGFEEVQYKCISERQQRSGDWYNCGLFAAFKGIDVVNKNVGNPDRILENFENEYNEFFNFMRYRVTEMLRKSGCNIELSIELVNSIKEDQIARENTNSGYFASFYNAATSLFMPMPDNEELRDNESKIKIANKYWKKPYFISQDDIVQINKDSHEVSENESTIENSLYSDEVSESGCMEIEEERIIVIIDDNDEVSEIESIEIETESMEIENERPTKKRKLR